MKREKRIDELIAELCPDGVEYKPLGEVLKYEQPTKYIVRNKEYDNSYSTPVLTAGQSFILGYTDEKENHYPASKLSPVIIFDDFTTATQWVDFEFKVKSSAMKILSSENANIADTRYVFFAIQCIGFTPGEHTRQWIEKFSKFEIPLPPLAVQKEIVRILDGFTGLIDELEAELVARRKQFEQYREKLLTFGDEVERKSLGEIGRSFIRGSGIKRDELSNEGVPCVRYGEIYTSYDIWFKQCYSHTTPEVVRNGKSVEYGDILFAITGESVDEIAKSCTYLGTEKCYAGGDIVIMKHNQDPKYLSYALSTVEAQKQKSKGKTKSKVVHSSVPSLKKIVIPIPSLPEQKKIVTTLDEFAELIDTTEAEIAARKKQYEYYREKLLTFKRKETA